MNEETIERLSEKIPELISLGLNSDIFQAQMKVVAYQTIAMMFFVLILAFVASIAMKKWVAFSKTHTGDVIDLYTPCIMAALVLVLPVVGGAWVIRECIQNIFNPAWSVLQQII